MDSHPAPSVAASSARRIALLAVVFGIAADLLFDRVGLGINVPIAVAGLLLASTLVRPHGAPIDVADLWLPPVALLAGVAVAIRTDPPLVFLDTLLAIGASVMWLVVASGQPVTRRSVAAVAELGLVASVWLGVGASRILTNATADGGFDDLRGSGRRALPIVRGLLLAVPILVVFAALLASADAVFAHVLDSVVQLPIDVLDLTTRAVLSLAAAWAIAGAFAIAAASVPLRLGERGLEALSSAVGSIPGPRTGSIEAIVVLVAVDILFAVFVVLQLAYLFGGLDTVAVAGITYSDYARQGYFQLVAVVVGAGGLLIVADFAASGPSGHARPFVAAALALLALTAVILASAAVRLGLYQQIYGWTELRFYVAASIAWLAICGLVATVLLLRDRMAWLLHGMALGAVAVTLAVSTIGPQAFITQMNLARALDPSLVPAEGHSGLDADYLAGLGDDAVPQLVEALPKLDPASRAALLVELDRRRETLRAESGSEPWQAWNLARERARDALQSLPGGS